MSINATTESSENRDFNKIKKYLTGYIRDIYYTSHDANRDPNNESMNKIIYIFEGYYENGVLSKNLEEKFGRLFLTNSHCSIGYFTSDQEPKDFLLNGKGMVIDGKSDEILGEGLFKMSRTRAIRNEHIEDFYENVLAID